MPQFLLHHSLAFNPQSTHRYQVEPALLWDLRFPADYARLASMRDRRVPSSVAVQYATSPPVPIFRITCGIFPYREWTIEVRNSRGVTVGDVLNALYRELRHRVSNTEWTAAPRTHQARVAETFYTRCRRSADPRYEQRAGVRRIDWLLKSTVFVGLTPSVERAYTWTLTTKRADK
ncbi:uncharacterized protein FOMMEDRAFT_148768 [Fomitiporia mediterranea MF3/22]|uniref:uncharacterized protein n=1 Tax=Fomitiporia mediterranea (strain MF3/22) TaxID=694068 RepID=UPI00044092EC|nr:uncharacterized protein FOMMEDRAFT_148768 [Fomitiporia mediterranea MF3/22]EJC99224.1 hypothetical protein FOMMEDRAFT_148768 [Fomitiporia mediterranea MF3/22]